MTKAKAKATPEFPTMTEEQFKIVEDLMKVNQDIERTRADHQSKIAIAFAMIDEQYGTSLRTNGTEVHTDRTLRPAPKKDVTE